MSHWKTHVLALKNAAKLKTARAVIAQWNLEHAEAHVDRLARGLVRPRTPREYIIARGRWP